MRRWSRSASPTARDTGRGSCRAASSSGWPSPARSSADPELILADEPTGNLDSANGAAVIDLLKGAAAAGTTVIMVTHSAFHAAAADRTIRMLDGRIVDETRL